MSLNDRRDETNPDDTSCFQRNNDMSNKDMIGTNKDIDNSDVESNYDDDGYDTDGTSSYDSESYPRHVFMEIRHHGDQLVEVPGLCGNQDHKRRKLNNGLASAAADANEQEELQHDETTRPLKFSTKNVRHFRASEVSSSPFLCSDNGANYGGVFMENPESILALCDATRFSYNVPSPPPSEVTMASSSSSTSIPPLLEQHLEAVKGAQKAQKLLEKAAATQDDEALKLPRPTVSVAVPNQALSRIVPSATSPAPTITFRKALEASAVPRLVTLSFAPFIVVHVNGAFTSLTGYSSSEVLGRPLKFIVDKQCRDKFNSSVTAMHDKLTSIVCKYQDRRCHCSVRVALVGPEAELNAPQEKNGEPVEDGGEEAAEDDTCVYVTHYGVDLEPLSSGGHIERSLISPDSSACGILG